MEDDNVPATEVPDSVSWTASEFVAHDKSSGWYLMLSVAALAIGVIIYLITRDIISVVVVAVAAIMLGIYGSHKPRQLEYSLDSHGIGIGQKQYTYDEFGSFAVQADGAFSGVVFMPLKRFSPPIYIYYPPEDEEKIIAVLSGRLPFEEHKRDAVDSLMKKIRF